MPATTHPFAELLPFFGSHLLPALHHPTPPVHVRSRPAAEASEEDLAQDQQSQRLPERNGMPAEDWRDEPVPKINDKKTENDHGNHAVNGKFKNFQNQNLSNSNASILL